MINIDIHADKISGQISPMIYGQMIEHAYWSVHLGLWAQMLDNGGFELDRDRKSDRVADGWTLISTSKENICSSSLDDEKPYNAKHSQKISVEKYCCGEIRLLQNNLSVRNGVEYRGFVFLRGKISGNISLKIMSVEKQILAEVSLGEIDHEEWKKVEFNLPVVGNCTNAAFAIAIRGEGCLWIDQIQMYPSDTYKGHGTRTDIVELYRGLKPSFMRWPGGTYLMWHHWKNGIGAHENRYYGDGRKLGMGVIHPGEWDPNTFGTDEFIQLCRDIETAPMINVNIKDGLQNTLDWIEYCNGRADTEWGAVRAKNGHPEPYNVTYWVVDNEPQHRSAEKGYAKDLYPLLARRWAEEMKKKDPKIITLIMGDHNAQTVLETSSEFSARVIQETSAVIDRICVHMYYDQTVYAPFQGMAYMIGGLISRLKTTIDQFCAGRDVKVAMTEWNPESYAHEGGNMGQALEAAQLFHILERKCAEGAIDMATPCQLCVNVDRYRGDWLRSAMVQINNHTAWTSPMYQVNAIYSKHFAPNLLEITSEGIPSVASRTFEGLTFPALDFVATSTESGNRIVIKGVNNTCGQKHEVGFKLHAAGKIKKIMVYEVSANSISTTNTCDAPKNVTVQEKELQPEGQGFSYIVNPYAVAVFEIICG